MTTVFVSGATGYIAQFVVMQLIEKGYKVIGSVRSEAKGNLLQQRFGENFDYEIVTDIAEVGAFDKPLQAHPEVVGFFHTACPVNFEAEDIENELLKPAIEGTKNVLKAIKQYGPQIKRLVLTSSFAAIRSDEQTPETIVDENTWNTMPLERATDNTTSGYRCAKTYSEKAAWDFLTSDSPNFTMNVVNPTYVLGPQASDSDVKATLNFSAEIINKLLKLKPGDPLPGYSGGWIDVRDVAKAHVVAYETDQTDLRLLLRTSGFECQLALDVIHQQFPQLSYLPKGNPGKYSLMENSPQINNSKTKLIVGEFISIEKTIKDSVDQILSNKA